MTRRLARLAVPIAVTVFFAAAGTGCAGHHPARRGQTGSADVPAPAASRTAPTSTTLPMPPPPWTPDPAAVRVAERYATAALSYTWQQNPQAWITAVAPICTPQWVAELRNDSDGGGGGWAAQVAGQESAAAHVLAVYPSAGPGPGRRLEVTARITTTGREATSATSTAVAVDLLPQPDGTWLVGWAG